MLSRAAQDAYDRPATQQAKRKRLCSAAGELYDLIADPDEMTNLFDDPAAAKVRSELDRMLATRPDDMREVQTQVGMA